MVGRWQSNGTKRFPRQLPKPAADPTTVLSQAPQSWSQAELLKKQERFSWWPAQPKEAEAGSSLEKTPCLQQARRDCMGTVRRRVFLEHRKHGDFIRGASTC